MLIATIGDTVRKKLWNWTKMRIIRILLPNLSGNIFLPIEWLLCLELASASFGIMATALNDETTISNIHGLRHACSHSICRTKVKIAPAVCLERRA